MSAGLLPIVGLLDDLLVVSLGVVLALRLLPSDVLAECRTRARVVAAAPTSWAGAAIVGAGWLAFGMLGFTFIRRLIRS